MRPYTWRQAIQRSKLPATTKQVLINLSLYINDAGQAAFPSIARQAEDMSLSARAVITHLKSVEGRWLSVQKHGYAGQRWALNEYLPRLPDEPELDVKGSEPRSPPSAENMSKGSEPRSLPFLPEGSERDDKKVVNDVHTNKPEELTNTTNPHNPHLLAIAEEPLRRWFDAVFWVKYPKHESKADAIAQLIRMRPDEMTLDAISKGIDRRLAAEAWAKKRGKFFAAWPDAHRWLRKRKWEDDLDVPRETSGVPLCHCGAVGVTGDGRRWYCRAHDPDRPPASGTS